MIAHPSRPLTGILLLVIWVVTATSAQQARLQFNPAKTTVKFTLGAALHTVHGTFQIKTATLEFNFSTGLISGEIFVDAKSGETGNGMRDRKMHKDVLESDKYPEISFRPDKVVGSVAAQGKSSVQMHGMFRIHGVDREITVPAVVEMLPDSWTAAVHFTVPYAKWGMKNPSTLFLRVSDSVEIDLMAAGKLVQHAAAPATDKPQ